MKKSFYKNSPKESKSIATEYFQISMFGCVNIEEQFWSQ